jgi:hypothetical protein
MKQALYALFVSLYFTQFLVSAPDPSKPIPAPDRMQSALWQVGELHDFKLEGFMRTEKNLHPIILRTLKRTMIFEFLKQPLQIKVQIIPTGSIVQKRSSSKEPWVTLIGKDRLENILDSDISYEDLGVDFLRWEDIKPIGGDSIKTLNAWAYEAEPNKTSQYAKARFWISADYLAVLRVDALNSKGQVVKRVEVNGVQRIGQTYTIKEMMVSNIIPGRDVSKSRTYIEIHKAEPGSGISNQL